MALLTFGAETLTFGGINLVFGDGDTPVVSVPRGDDAFRSSGVRERFWAERAEEWLEERLEQIPQVAQRPKRARRRFAEALLQRVEAEDIPQARVDTLRALLDDLTAPAPDYTALALDAQEWLAQMARAKRQWRDERDIKALQALGVL